jgi:hydroxyethylthiazole kinase-like sugar kinase family protein
MLRTVWQGPHECYIFIGHAIDSTHCRHMLSAHAHNLALYVGKGCQLSTGAAALISMQKDVDADAIHTAAM